MPDMKLYRIYTSIAAYYIVLAESEEAAEEAVNYHSTQGVLLERGLYDEEFLDCRELAEDEIQHYQKEIEAAMVILEQQEAN